MNLKKTAALVLTTGALLSSTALATIGLAASADAAPATAIMGDRVWYDIDGNGVQNAGEPGVAGFPVKVVGVDIDGTPYSASTVTSAVGLYTFTVPAGTYRVVFDPAGLGVDESFTVPNAGTGTFGDFIDSDGDAVTGETGDIVMPAGLVNNTIDQGIVVDQDVQVSVAKKVVSVSDTTADGHATVTYALTVANTGTAQGSYGLSDTLSLGSGITAEAVTASSPAATVDPTFDGASHPSLVVDQPIAGGATQVYTVQVTTVVGTDATTASRDCDLGAGESGTGYLNTAHLDTEAGGSEASACAPATARPVTEPTEPTATPTPTAPTTSPTDGPTDTDVEGAGAATDDTDGSDGADSSVDGVLPDTGGVGFWVLVAGLVTSVVGLVLLRAGASRRDRA